MRANSWFKGLVALTVLTGLTFLAWGASAEPKKKGEMDALELKLGEPMEMPAVMWDSLSFDRPGIVKAKLNKKAAQLTLVPLRQGTTIMTIHIKVPHGKQRHKGKIKLIVR